MVILALSLAALLVLVPVLYFLPVGLSYKGKLITILVAFFISLLAVFASKSLVLWQIIFLSCVLLFSISYMLDTRFRKALFDNGELLKDHFIDLEKKSKENLFKNHEKDKKTTDVNSSNQFSQSVESSNQQIQLEEENKCEDLNENVGDYIDVLPTTIDHSIESEHIEELDLEDLRESDSESQFDEGSMNEELFNSIPINIEVEDHRRIGNELVISPLEEILEEEFGSKDDNSRNDVLEEIDEEVYELEELSFIHTKLESNESEADQDRINSEEHIQFDILEESSSEVQELIEEKHVMSDELEELFQQNEVQDLFEKQKENVGEEVSSFVDQLDEINVVETEKINALSDEPNNDQIETMSPLQKQLLDISILQLKSYEKVMTSNELEEYIKSLLNDDMSETAYYLFSTELVKLYVNTGKYDELSKLIDELETKFKEYPLLHKQILYLNEQLI